MGRCMTGKTDLTPFAIISAMRMSVLLVTLGVMLHASPQTIALGAKPPDVVSTAQFSGEVSKFLGTELSAHLADVGPAPSHDLFDPAPERVLNVPTSREFSWST